MKQKFIIVCVLMGFFGYHSQAQVSSHRILETSSIDVNQKALAFGLSEREFEVIKPQAYDNSEFQDGIVYQDEKPVISNVKLRYNSYADEVELQKKYSEDEPSALLKDPNVFVKIGQDYFIYAEDHGKDGRYFKVLFEGERYNLYKKITSTYRAKTEAKSTYDRAVPAAFLKNETYYLIDNGTFLELPETTKRIQKMLEQNKKEMKDYIKKNKLNLKKEKDLIKAIQYFDSLYS